MPQKIDSFQGQYYFLSNFYPSPITDNDGITYPTVEHYFQAMKSLDISKRKQIASAPTPGYAKRLGRHVKLRPDWEEIKIDVMRIALRLKFSQPNLRARLINTSDAKLIEGNTWNDTYWGVCNNRGQNNLGKLLMEIRKEYQ